MEEEALSLEVDELLSESADASSQPTSPGGPKPPGLFIAATLTKLHYRRLRFYWNGRQRGGASHTDAIDLDLAGMGLIQRVERSGVVWFCITTAGEVELAAEKRREAERRRPHHDLGRRLAAWLCAKGRITWENIEFVAHDADTTQVADSLGLSRSAVDAVVRPDVFSMEATRNPEKMNPCIHEVKVSRADFLADVARPEKRLAYACLAEVVYYVCLPGIAKPEEVPQGCGLLVEHELGVFEVVKKQRRRQVTLSPSHFMNLMLKPGRMD